MIDSQIIQAHSLIQDALNLLANVADNGQHTVRDRYQLASARETTHALLAVVDKLRLCPASTLAGGLCERVDGHDGNHVNRGFEWTMESQLRLAEKWA